MSPNAGDISGPSSKRGDLSYNRDRDGSNSKNRTISTSAPKAKLVRNKTTSVALFGKKK